MDDSASCNPAPRNPAPRSPAPRSPAPSLGLPEGEGFPYDDATDALIQAALAEDHVHEDLTAAVLPPTDHDVTAELRIKAQGVVCGLPVIPLVFAHLAAAKEEAPVACEFFADDGDTVGAGFVVVRLHGSARAILKAERTLLNLVQRLSGIATLTAAFVEAAMATHAGDSIYDTRKTTPGWRLLEKYAVRCGGGRNHRLHLGDAAMIKENHLLAAYGRTGPDAVGDGVQALLASLPSGVTLYVEVEDAAELEAVLTAAPGAEAGRLVIMLDDFDLAGVRTAVRRVAALAPPRPALEVTGGVTLESVAHVAATGVGRISSGALTHSARALDMSLKLVRP